MNIRQRAGLLFFIMALSVATNDETGWWIAVMLGGTLLFIIPNSQEPK